MIIKKFDEFLLEKSFWEEIDFQTKGEKEVANAAEEALVSDQLVVVHEEDELFSKFLQISSSDEPTPVLQVTGHNLYMYDSPVEYLKWDMVGAGDEVIETSFIVDEKNLQKI